MNKITLILLIFISLSLKAAAQDFETGITDQEIEMAKYDKDPQANAVFLTNLAKPELMKSVTISGWYLPIIPK
ncbi:hypothetical protein ACRQ5D_29580 [Mucilaginibacter sp. P25]|uniref:hypothetical protein n=1 Tax=Mucilaginibacter sp. P25 TaxID=3423945 RepID=UPI003D795264